jgi:hypothetical protein
VRDVFDIAAVDMTFPQLLRDNLSRVAGLRPAILARLDGISEGFLRLELDELDITEGWRKEGDGCLRRVMEIIKTIKS